MSALLEQDKVESPATRLDFQDLLSPVTLEEFFARYWAKSTLFLQRGDREFFGNLMTLADVDRCLVTASADTTSKSLQVVVPPGSGRKNSEIIPANGVSKHSLYDAYLSGDTVRMIGVEKYWPPLALLLASMQEVIAAKLGVNMFLTPARSQAFPFHFDSVDVFVIQLAGSKKWTIWEPTYERPMALAIAEPYGAQISERDESKLTLREEVVLEAGDAMYMPRGFYHKAVAQDELSLHLTITIEPIYWLDFFRRSFELAALDDVELREELPPQFVQDARLRDDMAETFGRLMARFGDKASFDAAYRSLVTEQVRVRYFPPDGHFAMLETLHEIGPGTLLERRRGLVCLVETHAQTASIRFGPNRVEGPLAVAPAFEFMRDHREFRVTDLPGILSAESMVVLVRRLVREGLLRPSDGG
jgi:ribosomal protein L16 Arg81 hydroxylase